jgi:signal transduction histidine kinase
MAIKAYAIVLAVAFIPSLVAIHLGALQYRPVEFRVREAHLGSICAILSAELDESFSGFRGILTAANSHSSGWGSPMAMAGALNAALQPTVFRVARAFPRVELGFYSRAAQAEVAGAGFDGSAMAIRPVNETEFRVYQTGRPVVTTSNGKMVRYVPILEDGAITGHVWAALQIAGASPLAISSAWAMLVAAAVTAAALVWAARRLIRDTTLWATAQARQADERANEVAAAIVHELRNPIAVAKGLAELIMSRETDTKKQMWLTNLLRQMDRMNGIASDYLTYARPREPHLVSMAVAEVLHRVEADTEHWARQAGVDVSMVVANPDLEVVCDMDQLEQVLLNLVRNAIEALDAVPEGARSVELSAVLCGTGRVAIRVADNGPGILRDDMDKLFTPFFTTKQRGTGLGLAVSRRLVEHMGGKIEVRTGEGGTEFSVLLPAGGHS